MALISMLEACDATTLTLSALSIMVENGELINRSTDPDTIMFDKADIERVIGRIHILEFYDEFDDELKLREQNLILGREPGSDG